MKTILNFASKNIKLNVMTFTILFFFTLLTWFDSQNAQTLLTNLDFYNNTYINWLKLHSKSFIDISTYYLTFQIFLFILTLITGLKKTYYTQMKRAFETSVTLYANLLLLTQIFHNIDIFPFDILFLTNYYLSNSSSILRILISLTFVCNFIILIEFLISYIYQD